MTTFKDSNYDVVIIGGGPAGLSAALLLSRACRRVVLIDSGQPRNASANEIHGFLTRDGISPHDLRDCGRRELAKYGCEVVSDLVTNAAHVSRKTHSVPTSFVVETQKGRQLYCRKLLLATGISDKIPEFSGVKECYGTSIHHCPYCDGWEHRGKRLLAYGDSAHHAVGLGLMLRGWSSDVTVLTDGQTVESEDRQLAEDAGLQLVEQPIIRFAHQGARLQGVELLGFGLLPAEAMFFNTGKQASCDLARSLGLHRDDEFVGHTNRKQESEVPGVFIAGDADDDVQFSIVAAAEGAKAAVAINRELLEADRAGHFFDAPTEVSQHVTENRVSAGRR